MFYKATRGNYKEISTIDYASSKVFGDANDRQGNRQGVDNNGVDSFDVGGRDSFHVELDKFIGSHSESRRGTVKSRTDYKREIKNWQKTHKDTEVSKNGAAVLYDLVNIYDKKITEVPVTMASNDNSQRRQDASAEAIILQNSGKSRENAKISLVSDIESREQGQQRVYFQRNRSCVRP